MTNCACCDAVNIAGVDSCRECGQPLSDQYWNDPKTAFERHLIRDRIADLQPKSPICVAPEHPVGEVLKQLANSGIGCVLVTDRQQRLVGIFSERDAIRRIGARADKLKEHPVSEFMTPSPQDLSVQDRIAYAVHRMDLGGYRHVPITDTEGRAVGIVSIRDILGYLADQAKR